MRRYATSGAHLDAMQASPQLVAWFLFHHYQSETLPTQAEAYARWQDAVKPAV